MERLAVIGAGLMGGGIALDAARHGIEVVVYDARPEAGDALRARAAGVYGRWAKSGRMGEADAAAALERLRPVTELDAVETAGVVIEAVFEDLAVKRELFAALEGHLAPAAILATNTSALKVGDLSQGFGFAPRVLGLHYFSPAEVSPLVEVVRSEATSDATVERALAFLAATRRTPLPCRDRPGFAINRFFCPYYNEAARIVEDGLAGTADVDQVARERIGAAAGPFTVMNLIRPAVSAHAMTHLKALGPFYATSALLAAQAERGTDWALDTRVAGADLDAVETRLLGALVLPALELAAEQVAAPAAVDQGAVLALKFKEGPFALIRRYGTARVEAAVRELCARAGHPVPAIPALAAA
ncbi:3-hydroxyacyl-CoA dehydrogenase family protein [Xanthobacter sp. V4C-4]|uniref:3-hydroxyacyl-CoA dehydrogenase family protein n=1 Tax=Xanthobacter cornucopiae TaxID=3119924 RepID=UPI00372677BA